LTLLAGIDVPKAVDYAARFLAHLIEDKIIPEAILASLHHLCGQGACWRELSEAAVRQSSAACRPCRLLLAAHCLPPAAFRPLLHSISCTVYWSSFTVVGGLF